MRQKKDKDKRGRLIECGQCCNCGYRLEVPRGVLIGKEAEQRDKELKEKVWKNKQLEKKNYSHDLQENIVVKQVFQEKDKQKDQEL